MVGKPATALAELIKNAYDADATETKLIIEPAGSGRIEVRDDGHGMNFEEFRDFWMRVGSQHKRKAEVSRHFRRPLTGSKGIGRIAAQMLSRRISIETVSEKEPHKKLSASLDWEEAVKSGDLVDVKVEYEVSNLTEKTPPGTAVLLSDLRQHWTTEAVRDLAREVWRLQPPFAPPVPAAGPRAQDFRIAFEGGPRKFVEAFQEQMGAVLLLWRARVFGENKRGKVRVSLTFKGENPVEDIFEIPNCKLRNGRFEIRIYELKYRQPRGISVHDARDYLRNFGGVHIYDAGFRLPFYGEKDNDWLLLSYDMARRTSLSELLPRELQVPEGMQLLPQWSQVIGAVWISTSEEPHLDITITRDRLVEGMAFEQLRRVVRRAVHGYAMEKARRRIREAFATAEVEEPSLVIAQIGRILNSYSAEIPAKVRDRLVRQIARALDEAKELEAQTARQIAALSSLATAGLSALAYQHELNRQLAAIKPISAELEAVASRSPALRKTLLTLRDQLEDWAARARDIGRIFAHLREPEHVENLKRYKAQAVADDVRGQVSAIARSAKIETDGVDSRLRLPKATYAEWVSVFQNVIFNAINAMQDSRKRVIDISSVSEGRNQRILVQDTGVGVNLSDAERLFLPFVRKVKISDERRELGFGGTGLGLTITRMICERRGCKVYFDKPRKPFSTNLVIAWREAD